MLATVLNDQSILPDVPNLPDAPPAPTGHFEVVQDPDTGGITRVWVEDSAVAATEAVRTPVGSQTAQSSFEMPCAARGFTELGFRSSANNQTFEDGVYRATEVIQITFPMTYNLARNQLITNIRGRDKQPLWVEEETGQPTIFEVQGVTPTFDPFGRHVNNIAVLNRSVNQ